MMFYYKNLYYSWKFLLKKYKRKKTQCRSYAFGTNKVHSIGSDNGDMACNLVVLHVQYWKEEGHF
jgi:hypothetical protein